MLWLNNSFFRIMLMTSLIRIIKLYLEKAEEPEIKLPTSTGSWKKQESSRKTSTSALFTTLKPLTVWVTTNCGKFLKRGEYHTTWPAFWEICMQFRKQQFKLDMEQQTAFKSGKEYLKPVYYHPCLFNLYAEYIMRNTGWMKHKLESRLLGEISIISDM